MTEEVNKGNSGVNSNSLVNNEVKIRNIYVGGLITLSLIVGPVLLPFVLIWPGWFSVIPYMQEISIVVSILFVIGSAISAYYREKKTENKSS